MSVASIERRFMGSDGRLKIWPSKLGDQRRVMEWLTAQLTPGERLRERAFNDRLNALHAFGDWALLRRALVDHGFVQREPDGSAYWRPFPDSPARP